MTSTEPATTEPTARRRRTVTRIGRQLAATAAIGLVRGAATAAGGALVTAAIWWFSNR